MESPHPHPLQFDKTIQQGWEQTEDKPAVSWEPYMVMVVTFSGLNNPSILCPRTTPPSMQQHDLHHCKKRLEWTLCSGSIKAQMAGVCLEERERKEKRNESKMIRDKKYMRKIKDLLETETR